MGEDHYLNAEPEIVRVVPPVTPITAAWVARLRTKVQFWKCTLLLSKMKLYVPEVARASTESWIVMSTPVKANVGELGSWKAVKLTPAGSTGGLARTARLCYNMLSGPTCGQKYCQSRNSW